MLWHIVIHISKHFFPAWFLSSLCSRKGLHHLIAKIHFTIAFQIESQKYKYWKKLSSRFPDSLISKYSLFKSTNSTQWTHLPLTVILPLLLLSLIPIALMDHVCTEAGNGVLSRVPQSHLIHWTVCWAVIRGTVVANPAAQTFETPIWNYSGNRGNSGKVVTYIQYIKV